MSNLSASNELRALADLCKQDNVTYSMLASSLAGRTHAFVALIAAIPLLTPLPLPGLSLILGVFVTLVGLRVAANKMPWIPARWGSRLAPRRQLEPVFSLAAKILARLEGVVKERRFLPFSTVRFGGILIALAGVMLALPFPPGANFPPAWSTVFLALGVVEKDDLCWLAGFLGVVISVGFFVAVGVFGGEGIRALVGMF
jgi:hypothetical protein